MSPAAAPTTASGTVTVSPPISARLSVIVTSLVPLASPTSPAGALMVTVVSSSSESAIVADAMDETPVAAPDTVTVSS